MRIDDFEGRVRPVGVLYVDVHPFSWNEEQGLQFLLFRRKQEVSMAGQWQTVSGKLAAGERIAQGFSRQLLNKSGLIADRLFKMREVATFFDEHYDTVMLVPNALAFVSNGDVRIDDELHDQYAWLSADVALERLQWPTQRHAIEIVRTAMHWRAGELRVREGQFDVTEFEP